MGRKIRAGVVALVLSTIFLTASSVMFTGFPMQGIKTQEADGNTGTAL